MSRTWTRPLTLLVGAFLVGGAIVAGASAAPRHRALLPNIKALPVRTVAIGELGFYLSSNPSVAIGGCRLDEIAEEGARRCLRFDTIAANVGRGPLEIRYRVSAEAAEPRLVQRIYRSDESFIERDAAGAELHPIHGHMHYKGFAIARLWRANARGERLGTKPARTSDKNGFCLMDGEPLEGASPSDRRYDCLEWEPASGVDHVTGISPGWADVYRHELADQYIEITDLRDGHYLLATELDPSRTLRETTRRDNTTSTHIVICGDDVLVGGPGVSCTRPLPTGPGSVRKR